MVNVLSMTEGVQDHEGLGVLLGIRDPQTKFHKIRQLHKSIKEQKEAILHLWYTTHPLASWSLLHQALNMIGDIKAAKTVQEKFLGGVLLTLGRACAARVTAFGLCVWMFVSLFCTSVQQTSQVVILDRLHL